MSNEQITNLDDAIQVELSEDRMLAFLIFKRVEGNIQLTVQDLVRILNSRGVKHGLQQDVLNMIAGKPQDFYFSQNVVAKGTSAQNGTDGYIKELFSGEDPNRKPVERSDGSIDYREINQLANVKTGQLIAERYPPLPGIPGMDVAGNEMMPRDGKEAHFKVGKNVVVNAERTAMYSAIDGLVTKTEKDKLNVFPVYEVNGDVDYHIGNIDFVGTVVIRGNILSGFKVRASGDIRVTGGIEGAEVESDGSIEISGGIIGNNKGLVKAGRSIKCSFIQEGIVQANEDVIVSQSIMHSSVKAGKEIICMGAKGLIVGGTLQAGDKITARMVGNAMSTATSVEVGVRPELRQELGELRAAIRTQTDSLDKTDKALALLNQLAAAGQLTPQRLTMRLQLTATRKQTADDLQRAKEQILEIERALEDTSMARVDVVHTIFGGTKIMIGRYTRFIKDSLQRVSFRFSDGEIVPVPYI